MSDRKTVSWPPSLSTAQIDELTRLATTYALSHGHMYLPLPGSTSNAPLAPISAIHAPLSLFPTPFPRVLFDRANWLQKVYNVLYARIAMDTEFLDRVMGTEGAGAVDEFVKALWMCWKTVRDEGIAQVTWSSSWSAVLWHTLNDMILAATPTWPLSV